jgi:DNA adenine methylase
MRYMGGKARIAGRLAPVILDVIRETGATTYWEPFLGGANIFTRVVPHVETAIGSDVMPDLIMMWQAIQRGWLPPDFVTREEYAALRRAEPSALRAFVGFGCSFGGKWFGGYGAHTPDIRHPRDHVSYGSAIALRKQIPAIQRARVALLDYRDARPRPGWAIYCDPPYAGTTTYTGADAWDADEFWTTAQRWAESGCHVLVSEYAAPDGWSVLWEGETRGSLDRATNATVTTERLFAWKG